MTHKRVSDAPDGEPGSACFGPDGSAHLVQRALDALDGRWKLAIIFRLFATSTLRFSELERSIPGVSQKMLTQRLRELERDGVIARTIHAAVPPRVDYCLTTAGEALRPALRMLRDWSASTGGVRDLTAPLSR
jgi:DNA-binding HxlR family transcriptional regulator